MSNNNPFIYKNLDDIQPLEVVELFVPVFGEYHNVPEVGHTFINGSRGSGKSMIFRYMQPDCQVLIDSDGKLLAEKRTIKSLNYFSIYIPIKKGQLDKTDIQITENRHGEAILNEHFMVLHFSIKIFEQLSNTEFENTDENIDAIKKYYNEILKDLLINGGWTEAINDLNDESSINEIFQSFVKILKKILKNFEREYLQKLIGAKETLPYKGPIFLYSDFLYEILKELKKLPLFAKATSIFLLIDDADNLNSVQKMILNSWVSQRTTADISLKISTQLRYNIYRTINGSRIDTPHDYSEVNLNDIYTTVKDVYYKRVKDMVEKRLHKFGHSGIKAHEFFPVDEEQENKITEKFEKYQKERIEKGESKEQAYYFAYRYSRPDFIRDDIKGNRNHYSYSGFNQLVNISSGVLREFIDFASKMYVAEFSRTSSDNIKRIDPSTQTSIIRIYSNDFFNRELDKFITEQEELKKSDVNISKIEAAIPIKLRNLINGLGALFNRILVSEASERRVFSVALNDEPTGELKEILELGVHLGYLQKSLIGNKYGTGKSRLFILNRLLAPHFGLDPTNFAGYKFMDSNTLRIAIDRPKEFPDIIIKESSKEESNQTSMFQ